MRKVLVPALLTGLALAACGDDTSGTGGGGEGGDGASSTTTTTTTATTTTSGGGEGGGTAAECGDGNVETGEACDDGNTSAGDGCSASCAIETGYECAGEPSVCATDCGDGILAGAEACDDSNQVADDGCSLTCTVETGFDCTGTPSVCTSTCGDSVIAADEGCDDGQATPADGDGCSATCGIEAGWACAGTPSVCETNCGDGVTAGIETCDDGNMVDDDGCTACAIDTGFTCDNTAASVCTATCGDGIIAGMEECDDSNTVGGDCCSAMCEAEAGCEIEPNNTIATANDFMALQVGGFVNGFVDPSGDVNYYMFTLTGPGAITAETFDGILGTTCTSNDVDTRVRIFDAMGTELAGNDDGGAGFCSLAVATNLAAGTYYIAVDASTFDPTLTFDYALGITVDSYVCGDGDLDPGEGCDDGGTMSGNGCSDMCQVESGYTCTGSPSVCTFAPQGSSCGDPIVASNGFAFAGANIAQFGNTYTFSDASCVSNTSTNQRPDMIFAINLNAGQFLRVTELGTLDVLIHILGTTCGATACNASTDFNETTSGALYGAPTTGTYYVVVESFSGTPSAASTYDVRFEVITPVCGNGTIELGEQCDDSNTTPGEGCSATCQVETGFVCSGTPSVCTSVLPGCTGTVIVANAANLPVAIPDMQPAGGAERTMTVTNTGTITNMAMGFSATHSWVSDVDLYLTGPDMTQREVCTDNGSSGDNFSGTIFRDDGTPVTSGVAPFSGVFAPEQLFSFYNGQSVTGDWTVRVADDATGDVGTVTQLYLAFCVTP